jgi:hypothetical protein
MLYFFVTIQLPKPNGISKEYSEPNYIYLIGVLNVFCDMANWKGARWMVAQSLSLQEIPS